MRFCHVFVVRVKDTPFSVVSRSLIKHCPILIVLVETFRRCFDLNWWFRFPPHLTGVTALPGETESVFDSQCEKFNPSKQRHVCIFLRRVNILRNWNFLMTCVSQQNWQITKYKEVSWTVFEIWVVKICHFLYLRPVAYITACTTVQAVTIGRTAENRQL